MTGAPTSPEPRRTGCEVPTPGLQPPAPAGGIRLGRNLDSSFRHRWANGATTVLVLAGAGLAMGLLHLGSRRPRGVGLLGLLLVLAVGHFAESELVATLLPRLLR